MKNARFAAKLLFQFRVGNPEESKFRICEERIVAFRARDADGAYTHATKLGLEAENSYFNDSDTEVFYEFIGIKDLMELGVEAEPHDVWYEIRSMLTPMERKSTLIPEMDELEIFK